MIPETTISPHAQRAFDVRFEWGEEGLLEVGPGAECIVIVDVFSFSTAVDVAVSRGARVYPYSLGDDGAAAFAEAHGAVLAGRRSTQDAFSLSPTSLQSVPSGTKLVLPSPNGSHLAKIAATSGATVMLACLRNAAAVARVCAGRTVVIAAGERWPNGRLRPAVEDLCGAGAVLAHFAAERLSPEAHAAVAAFRSHVDLARCGSAMELHERGFDEDVRIALDADVSATVPVLVDGAFRQYEDRSS